MKPKKNTKYLRLLLLFLVLLTGCSTKNTKPDFGTEVINTAVQLPEVAYKEDLLACYFTNDKMIYTLGPRHQKHFYPQCDYSLQDIQVELIDWYLTDDEAITKTNSTSDERDNQIFYNIYDKMEQVEAGETVLICYGDMHFYYQQPRMERAGWEKQELTNAADFY